MEPKHYGMLLFAAVLEVSGDAIVREGLTRWQSGWKILAPLILVGGVALLGAYSVYFNQAPLPLGVTFGLYVVFFAVVGFVVGSIRDRSIDWWALAGVAIIVAGGLVIRHGEHLRHVAKAG